MTLKVLNLFQMVIKKIRR